MNHRRGGSSETGASSENCNQFYEGRRHTYRGEGEGGEGRRERGERGKRGERGERGEGDGVREGRGRGSTTVYNLAFAALCSSLENTVPCYL